MSHQKLSELAIFVQRTTDGTPPERLHLADCQGVDDHITEHKASTTQLLVLPTCSECAERYRNRIAARQKRDQEASRVAQLAAGEKPRRPSIYRGRGAEISGGLPTLGKNR